MTSGSSSKAPLLAEAPLLDAKAKPPRRVGGCELLVVLLLLVGSGSVNFLLLKVMFTAYGEENAFFVSQGVNVLYVIYGGLVTYPRLLGGGVGHRLSSWMGLDPITPAMRGSPQRRFIVMGLLDCFGTFFTAMGAVHTPGQFQPLLNQSLVPCTMVVSCVMLRTRYSWRHTAGALLIVCGALISLAPTLAGRGAAASAAEARLYAIAIYWLSNVPMACSAVYKEARFHDEAMDVCWLTQWVSIYQLLFGFVLMPLQDRAASARSHTHVMYPASAEQPWSAPRRSSPASARRAACRRARSAPPASRAGGASCRRRPAAARRGTRRCCSSCTWASTSSSTPRPSLWGSSLGPAGRRVVCYSHARAPRRDSGLWLTKHGGAVLNAISYALLVPLTTVFFSFPFMGDYRETLHPATFGGLAAVLAGFALWRYATIRDDAAAEAARAISPPDAAAEPVPPSSSSFHERAVGMELARPLGRRLIKGICSTGSSYEPPPPSLVRRSGDQRV